MWTFEFLLLVRILQFWLPLSQHLRSRRRKNKPISLVHYNKSIIWQYLWAIFTGNIICKDSYYSHKVHNIHINKICSPALFAYSASTARPHWSSLIDFLSEFNKKVVFSEPVLLFSKIILERFDMKTQPGFSFWYHLFSNL